MTSAFQDNYSDFSSHCYGCGHLNEHGLQIKSYWDGDESVCHFKPHAYHTAMPGYVYGGLIASLIDCHSTATAAAAACRQAGCEIADDPTKRFVTASLKVDFLKPTPIDTHLEVRARIEEIKQRKVVLVSALIAKGETCARGRVVAVLAPPHLLKP
jgi:acyl-coenzyme A thioesterase PaaI-like protein